jgi:hypothetical protein
VIGRALRWLLLGCYVTAVALISLGERPEQPPPAPPEPSRRRLVWLLVAITTLSLAAGAVRLSAATFSSTSSNTAEDLAAGTLQLQSPASGLVLIDAASMRPGETRYALVTLRASGNVAAHWSVELKGAPAGSTSLAHALVLRIEKDAGSQQTQTLYKGPLDALTRTAVGSSAPDVDVAVRVSLEWPATVTDPSLPGTSTAAELLWRAGSS